MQELDRQHALHVTVDILMLSQAGGEMRLLLSRRREAPFAGCWALPGRFIRVGESAETAVEALLEEMLPAEGAFLEQLYTFSDLGRDPRGRVISIAYLVILPWPLLEPLLADERVILKPFSLRSDTGGVSLTGAEDRLRGSDLAFDHGRIVETGVRRLQGKVDYSPIAFRFLRSGEAFSLSELQQVFEAIGQRPLDDSNFRRFILNRWGDHLQPARGSEKHGRGRPATLYRFDG